MWPVAMTAVFMPTRLCCTRAVQTPHWVSHKIDIPIRLLSSWPLVKIWTGPVHFRVTLDTLSGYPEPWSSKIPGSDREMPY